MRIRTTSKEMHMAMANPSSSSSPKKKRNQSPPPVQKTKSALPPTPPPETSIFDNPPLTPAELIEGLSKVVEELNMVIEYPPQKAPTKQLTEQMEKIRQMSTFLTAVYANMIRIAVEEEELTPQPPNTEDQKALAQRIETLGWTLRALQEKAAIRMNPSQSKPPVPTSAIKRKSRMKRSQGDSEWKRM